MREEVGLASSHHLRLQYVSISAIPNLSTWTVMNTSLFVNVFSNCAIEAYAIWARRVQDFRMYL